MPAESVSRQKDLLMRLTPGDVQNMLEKIEHDKTQSFLSGRYPVYQYKTKNKSFALKLADQNTAYSHVLNAELFEFFGIPTAPCVALPLGKSFDIEKFFESAKFYGRARYSNSHVIVMPYVGGVTLGNVICGNRRWDWNKEEGETILQKNILNHAVPLCLTDSWDCQPKNVIVGTSTKTACFKRNKAVCDSDQFTFIDAEYALRTIHTDTYKLDPLAVLKLHYIQPLLNKKAITRQGIRNDMLEACDYWQKEVRETFTLQSPKDVIKDLKNTLLSRADLLREQLLSDEFNKQEYPPVEESSLSFHFIK